MKDWWKKIFSKLRQKCFFFLILKKIGSFNLEYATAEPKRAKVDDANEGLGMPKRK